MFENYALAVTSSTCIDLIPVAACAQPTAAVFRLWSGSRRAFLRDASNGVNPCRRDAPRCSGAAHAGAVPLLAAPAQSFCVDEARTCSAAAFVFVHGAPSVSV